MTTQVHTVPDDATWHELRSRHIGASESEALLGVCKYATPFTLYHRKRGTLPEVDLDDERVFWGTHMEATIAMGLAKQHGLRVRKARHYLTNDNAPGAGASLDYTVDSGNDGFVPFEIKNVDSFVFLEEWDRRNGILVPPVHIDIQVQQQMLVSGAP
ncbi:MAG: YqaJ viral recombinase family protein, partial [Verrucomicrobiales bacterium]|nr:YqaJ viral recombinase family protein [Verrucomicrobiales bacterium]